MKNLKATQNKLVELPPVYGGIDEDGQPILVKGRVVQEVSEQYEQKMLKDEEKRKANNPKSKPLFKSLGVAWEGVDSKGVRVVMTEAEAKNLLGTDAKVAPAENGEKK